MTTPYSKAQLGRSRPLATLLGYACAPLFIGGCLSHRAVVNPPPLEAGQTQVIGAMGGEARPWHSPYEQSSAFAEEIPASVWLRDADGNLLRGDVILRTPRPWWERFPVDAITDLLPIDFVIHAETTIEVHPIAETSPAALDAAAIKFGYASDSQNE